MDVHACGQGITFHDGTPLDADAVIYNLQATGTGLLVVGLRSPTSPRSQRRRPAVMELKIEKVDDMTFTIFTGKGGDPDQPVPWPGTSRRRPRRPVGPDRLADVARGGRRPTTRWRPSRSAPARSSFESYAPRDRLVVTRNPDYWLTDAAGNQLPYLDRIEFRVIEDGETMGEALQSGDIDIILDVLGTA